MFNKVLRNPGNQRQYSDYLKGYMWILLQGENGFQFILLFPQSFIGQLVH